MGWTILVNSLHSDLSSDIALINYVELQDMITYGEDSRLISFPPFVQVFVK